MSTYRNLSVAGITGLVLTLSLGMASPVRAGYAVAPDVVVFCAPTLRHAVSDVGALWRQQTGVPVRVFTSPTEALLQQIAHHARDDVLIGEGDGEARAATGQNLVQPETLRKLWRNQLVVAAPGAKFWACGQQFSRPPRATWRRSPGERRSRLSIRGRRRPEPRVKRRCNL